MNRMKTIGVLSFVFLYGFVLKGVSGQNTEGREFCEAFVKNNLSVDYSFNYLYHKDGEVWAGSNFVIDYDVWNIKTEYNGTTDPSFAPNKSAIVYGLGNRYSIAFSYRNTNEDSIDYGFIERHNFSIVWKRYNGSAQLFSEFYRTPNQFRSSDFSITFRELTPESGPQRQVFVSQHLRTSLGNDYQRKYVSVFIENNRKISNYFEENKDYKNNLNLKIPNTSNGKDKVIGVFGPGPNKRFYLIFYSVKTSIEYCYKSLFPNQKFDLECNNRKVFKDCKDWVKTTIKTSTEATEPIIDWMDFRFWICVVLIIFAVILIIAILWADRRRRKQWTYGFQLNSGTSSVVSEATSVELKRFKNIPED